ncbi:ABC transporter ATP-binding protein [Mesorhizobium sp. 113-3-3]|uniref:ABC transporter ATP-binding protein n=1 Tax=Mesorhizobium sp. 113-3-3 TaxID=2744516 RepID=UPI0019378669|nr:ABC transporter ATP-binding protein [Mesorhizobium sp. 113-3-3]BCG82165.1 ABC transporter ATP-binding protein [Mesorhizobium sp. 113-3-3]
MNDVPLIELRNIGKTYGSHTVLREVNLQIGQNEFLVVVGPSGSGKTTILRMIGGFVEPSSGDILLNGSRINGIPVNRRPFNTVFQDYALFPHMTVDANVGYGLRVKGMAADEAKKLVAQTLDLVGLGHLGKRYPAQMSGGQRQRVALARALICKPRLVLLDEPLAALDAGLRHQMQTFLKSIQREIQTSFLFITHDQEEAIGLADRICIMDHGEIVQVGQPGEVYYRPRNPYVADFFGDNNLIDAHVTAVGLDGLTVQTPFGSALATRDRETQFNVGAPVIIAVRPENVALAPAEGSEPIAIVRSVSFVGPLSVIEVESAKSPGAVIHIKQLSSQLATSLEPGAGVSVSWKREETWVIRK